MADNPIPLKPKKIEPPEDALDIDSLWLDPKLGDGLVDVHRYNIPMGKPRDYFRVISDPNYRRLAEVYTHKVEGQFDEQHYLIAPSMQGKIEEARRCALVTCIYRDGSLRLWPLKLPKDGVDRDSRFLPQRQDALAASLADDMHGGEALAVDLVEAKPHQ